MTQLHAPPWRPVAEYPGGVVLLHDSIQVFDDRAAGAVIVTGSHMGTPASLFGAATGAKGLLGNDAGGGRDDAGVGGLAALEPYSVAAVAVAHTSARIGDGQDTYDNGVVTAVNRWAAEVGVTPGMPAARAAELLTGWQPPADRPLPTVEEGHTTTVHRAETPRVLAVDSASQIGPGMEHDIVVTGSHGGAVGGVGVRARVAAAFFNDAGVGKDDAGVSRLPLLDDMGIPGVTVSKDSARIGFGDETYRHGVVSSVNEAAAAAGVRVGMTVQAAALMITAIGKG
jgi:hypothetical protein